VNRQPSQILRRCLCRCAFQIANTNDHDIVLIGSTRRGKELAARLAQKMQAGCITDAGGIELKGQDLVVHRYTLGGNTLSSEVLKTAKKVISVLPNRLKRDQNRRDRARL